MPWRAPWEQVSERICEQIVDVQVPQDVEQAVEVPKISSPNRIVRGTVEQILDVLVPEMVEQLMKLLITESQDRIQQRTAQVAEGLLEVFKFFPQDRIQRFEEKTVEVPQSQIVEKIDETPEIQTVQEHSAVLAQLASRISGIMMKFWSCDWRGSVREGEGFDHRIDQPVCRRKLSKTTLRGTHPHLKQPCPDLQTKVTLTKSATRSPTW